MLICMTLFIFYAEGHTAQLVLYLAFVYLAEAVIIMPSPRNQILDFFDLAAAPSGNGQSAKSKFFYYQYLVNTKIQNSAAA